jgi:predicted Zn-ribbon and HTH transcriptional regulator
MRLAEAQGFENKPPASAMQNSRCPECNSGNYMKRGSIQTQNGSVEAWNCYDCGYPLRQTTSGMSGSGPVSASKQIATGGWNPTAIIGRL